MENQKEKVQQFLAGRDPLEHIVSIECAYNENQVSIIYVNADGKKMVRKDDFKPFVWAKNSIATRMFDGDRQKLLAAMREFGIKVKGLKTKNEDGKTHDRIENGYRLLFYATHRMAYQAFLGFFQKAGTPIYEPRKKQSEDTKTSSSREFLAVSPVEQYMMASGKRMFKGYDGYDELKRLQFDLETQGLNPRIHAIDQIGIRTNKGFEKIITVEGDGHERKVNELAAIIEFVSILAKEKPDVVIGHNSENFDWNFIIVRCEMLGTSLEEISLKFFSHPIYKKNKETVLKLGGEVEYYKPTIMWGHSIIDSLHAVRRAQAIDSDMKKATLKYVTKYLDLKKPNRVYVPGQHIGEIWRELEPIYAFNNSNGDWYKLSQTHQLDEGYEKVSGRYIVERYLLDDIWETDKVELALNEANFLICKMMPTTFSRAATMGTAGIWKLIMLAWCYENGLAIPAFGENKRFVGGLSRLLKTGFTPNVVKLDYNSLYPSIMLTWNIINDLDIDNVILMFLEYVLSTREHYKGLKAEYGGEAKKLGKTIDSAPQTEQDAIIEKMQSLKALAASCDKKQLPMKILANSVFGAFGGPGVFPFGNISAAEKVTCIGRQCLRLMISHFTKLGYSPIVGDSFTKDTPVFIKYENDFIDIVPIEYAIDESAIEIDELGREYDYSKKPFKVLCRSGWVEPSYIYRHKTDKPIYKVSEDNMEVEVTEDHSLFDSNQQKVKPSEIAEETKLEYYRNTIEHKVSPCTVEEAMKEASLVKDGRHIISMSVLNSSDECKQAFIEELGSYDYSRLNKTERAKILFIKKEAS